MSRSRPIEKGRFRSRTAPSLPDLPGVTTHRRKTTKPLAVPNLSWLAPPRTGSSLWSRTQKNTPRLAAGDSLILTRTTASPLTRRCSKPAFPATRLSKIATWSSPVTHLNEVTSIKRKVVREMEAYAKTTESSLTVMQRVASCFTGGVLGALVVVLFSHILFGLGISGALGVKGPVSLKSPDIYRPLFWGGLWGIPFELFIKTVWERLYFFGLLYFVENGRASCREGGLLM